MFWLNLTWQLTSCHDTIIVLDTQQNMFGFFYLLTPCLDLSYPHRNNSRVSGIGDVLRKPNQIPEWYKFQALPQFPISSAYWPKHYIKLYDNRSPVWRSDRITIAHSIVTCRAVSSRQWCLGNCHILHSGAQKWCPQII